MDIKEQKEKIEKLLEILELYEETKDREFLDIIYNTLTDLRLEVGAYKKALRNY